MAGQDLFETYFTRADLDGDSKISGAEAVSFFQGSNLPKQVLAQIWGFVDQSHTGFLGRPEFFNFLKLVTVAQSKRELTPDIVKAALYGPAASKIPPPQINATATPTRIGPTPISATSQNVGFTASVPKPNANQQFNGAQPNQLMRPAHSLVPGAMSPVTQVKPQMGGSSLASPIGTTSRSLVGIYNQPQSSAIPLAGAMPQAGSTPRPGGMPQPGVIPQSGSISQVLPVGGTFNLSPQVRPVVETNNSSSGTFGQFLQVMPVGSAAPISQSPQPMPSQLSQPQSIANKANEDAANFFAGSSGFLSSLQPQSVSAVPPSTDAKINVLASNVLPRSSGLSNVISTSQSSSALISTSNQAPLRTSSLDSLQNAFAAQIASSQTSKSQSLPDLASHAASTGSPIMPATGFSSKPLHSSESSHSSWPKILPPDVQKYSKVFVEVDTDRDGKITGEQAKNLFLSWRLPREILKQVWDLSDQDNDSMLSLREFCYALYFMERFREGRQLPPSLPLSIMHDETLLSMTGQSRATLGNTWGPVAGHVPQPGVATVPHPSPGGLRPPIPMPRSRIPDRRSSNQINHGVNAPFLTQDPKGQKVVMPANEDLVSENKSADADNGIMDSREKIEYYRSKMQELVLFKSRCDSKLNEITEKGLSDKREAEILGKKYEEKYKQVAESASKLTIEEAAFRDVQTRKMELTQAIVIVEQGGGADGLLQVRADRIQSDLDELMKALTERAKKHSIDVNSSTAIELPPGWQPGIPEGAAIWDEEWDKFEDEGFSIDVSDPNKGAASQVNGTSHSQNGTVKDDSFLNDDDHSDGVSPRSPKESDDFDAKPESNIFDDSAWLHMDNDDVDSAWNFNATNTNESDGFGSSKSDYEKKNVFFEESVPGTPGSRFGNSPRYSEVGDQYDAFSRFDSMESGVSPVKKDSRFSFDDSDPFGSSGPFRVFSDK